jgi:hypothetical protein
MDPSSESQKFDGGRVAQVFDLAGITNKVGAPSFAVFAKGGYHERLQLSIYAARCRNEIAGWPSFEFCLRTADPSTRSSEPQFGFPLREVGHLSREKS